MTRAVALLTLPLAFVAMWLVAGPAQLGGGATYVTTYGDSMEPAIRGGDLVLVRQAPEYGVGDAVAYRSEALGTVILHRVVAVNAGHLTVRGDNNAWADPDRPGAEDILGAAWLRIPAGGTWLRRIANPPALSVAAFALVATSASASSVRHRRNKDRRPMAHQPPSPHHTRADATPLLRSVAVGIIAGGWSATVPLAEPQRFSRLPYEGMVTLDLTAISARADAAAAITGLPATTIDIAVVPRVSLPGGGAVAPRLEFTMDQHAVRLTGVEDADALTVEEAVTIAAPDREPATLSAMGRHVEVATARTVSLAALAVAAAVAGVLVALRRAGRAMTEPERLRRRHRDLILPVLPVALPAGRPVIDVPGVEPLITLAEPYGLLVLHWSRSGVDTYVVQDDATTYRYRTSRATEPDEGAGTNPDGWAAAGGSEPALET